jgi:DEAD/DEAH box helicase domain-containing protein
MTNPLKLFSDLRETYLKYLDSPFDLRYGDLISERRELLGQDGKLYRAPLIEPLTAYEFSGQSFAEVADEVFGSAWPASTVQELKEFVGQGLMPPSWEVFQHQKEVLLASSIHGRNVVVTTGTGSGKTECFLLPLAAALVKDSANWAAPAAKPAKWKWWGERADPGSGRTHQPRIAQRQHETRPSAIRALILYPYNALVEDQLGRLRDGFDSSGARSWLDTQRNGNHFYFGRYVGRTPVSGDPSNIARERVLRAELASIERDFNLVRGHRAERYFQDVDSAEMWSRWDMQDDPADILITNYSMLNIMLV